MLRLHSIPAQDMALKSGTWRGKGKRSIFQLANSAENSLDQPVKSGY
jgi:hypothetical protein